MDEEEKKMVQEILNNPQRLAYLGRSTVEHMLEQQYSFGWGCIHVIRKETLLTIEWRFHNFIENPEDYLVVGHRRRATLIPDPSYAMEDLVTSGHGNGSARIELEEGSIYYFKFNFANPNRMGEKPRPKTEEIARAVDFYAGVPFSVANQKIVDKALAAAQRPEERIRQVLESEMKMDDMFDEMTKQGIDKIKAKHLPAKNEEDRLRRFLERVEQMKDDFGI